MAIFLGTGFEWELRVAVGWGAPFGGATPFFFSFRRHQIAFFGSTGMAKKKGRMRPPAANSPTEAAASESAEGAAAEINEGVCWP